ncbi:MAG: tetratricopeptide repeat protein, partial [Gammaproteobacteria bacterium]|nr:tetratricopeptide repeat protein [Gammaproteobacteria bacterium]
MKTFPVVAMIFMLSACASNKPATLGSLSGVDFKIEKSTVSKVGSSSVMKRYRQFLDDVPANHPLYGEALNRLADLEMIEGDKKLFVDEKTQIDEAAEAMQRGKEKGSQTNYQNAIELYESLLVNGSDEHRADWILYQLSRAYEQSENLEGAVVTLQRLLQEYPKSNFMPESRFRLAELQYGLRDYESASYSYMAVLNLGRGTPFYDKSIYKMGWALFKQEKYNDALAYFFVAIKLLPIVYGSDDRINISSMSQLERDLLTDLFRAINLSFSYLGGPQQLTQYFRKYPDNKMEYEVFLRLGEFYSAGNRVEDAANTYEEYASLRMATPKGAVLQLLKIETYSKKGYIRPSLQAREEFIERFASKKSFWDSLTGTQRRSHGQRVQSILKDLTAYYHAQAQKTKKREDYLASVRWYDVLVKLFPGAETMHEQFLLAELYYQLQDYNAAITRFETVAYDLPKRKESVDAGYSALLSHERRIKNASVAKKDGYLADYVESSFRFLTWFSDDKRAASVRIKTAERLFSLNRYDESLLQARLVLQAGNAVDKDHMSAYLIIGHVAFDKQNYQDAEKYYELFLKGKFQKNLKPSVRERLAIASYKLAEEYQGKEQYTQAVNALLKTEKLSNDIEIKARSVFDVATIYIVQKDWIKAIPHLQVFIKQYPKHHLRIQAHEKLLVAFQSLDRGVEAADIMVYLSRQEKDVLEKRKYLWNAANLQRNAGRLDSAVSSYDAFRQTFSQPDIEALEAMHQISLISRKKNQTGQYKKWLRDIITYVDKSGLSESERGRYLAAQGSFYLAEGKFTSFKRLKLDLPLKRSLKRKRRAMSQALDSFEKVLTYAVGEFTTASTHRIAEIYAELGKAVLNSSRPKGLSVEEK